MNIGIPIWMLALSLLAGLAAATLLYFRNKKQHYGKALNAILFALRTLMVGLVVLLLFNPLIRQKFSSVETPTIILAHDNSSSVVLCKDSAFYKKDYLTQFEQFRKDLNAEFQVDEYLFGEEVRDFEQLDFSDQLTDLSSLIKTLDRRYYKRNVGAVLLFSDGIYNRGFEPELVAENFPFPIHTVVLGDTVSYPDLAIRNVHYNKVVSLGATFPIRITVAARDLAARKAQLTLKESGRITLQQRMNQPSPMDNSEYAAFIPVLDKNTLNAFRNGERQPIGDVLLTGATGYLGIHILNELLTNYHGKILCPIRAKGNNEALSRIKTLYFYYFGRTEAFNHFDERVTAFTAEITEPDALERAAENSRLSTLNSQLTVVNCVANVKHFSAGNDIEMVNIESVCHLIAFCLRTGSRLIHISTNSIAGISIDDVPGPEVKLTEQNLYIGQNIDANKYVYSKFKAEELVLDAIAHHGLNAKIMRVGNLSARQKDGEFQINFNTNNFLAMLRAYVVIGMVPYEALDERFEFSPIDEVAHAIMLLSQTPKDCTVFHPNNTHRQFLSDVLIGFAKAGITLKRVESEEFQQALDRMMENPDLVTLLRPLMAYDMGAGHKTRWIESTNDYTTQVLYRCGFQWPPTAADYVHRFVDTIIGFDYFNV